MTARDQILADAISVALRSNARIIRQRRIIICLLIIIVGLIGGYFIR